MLLAIAATCAATFATVPCHAPHQAPDLGTLCYGLVVQAERVGYVNGWRAPPARCRPPLAAAQRRPGRHPKALAGE
ncbi:hypothetical protein HaLaN_15930, partial [Haematococcus lacustris]